MDFARPPDVFIIGAPRSGTTWLQRLLGYHPDFATPRETHFAHEFLAPAEGAWQRQKAEAERNLVELAGLTGATLSRMGGTFGGVPGLFSEDEFYGLLRLMYERLRDRCLTLKPGATVFLEKTPSNSLHIDLLSRVSPKCRFVHLIRDPTAVVASILGARRGWGRAWAPDSADAAARTYRSHVEGALSAQRFGGRYRELRYEDLRRDATTTIFKLLSDLGVSTDRDQCRRLVRTVDEPAVGSDVLQGPYVGGYAVATDDAIKGSAPAPRAESISPPPVKLSSYERWCVERQTSELMARFGYPTEHVGSSRMLYEGRRVTSRAGRGFRYEWRQVMTRLSQERSQR
jgi:hypothetical protein